MTGTRLSRRMFHSFWVHSPKKVRNGLMQSTTNASLEHLTETLREALPDIIQLLKEDPVRLAAATAIELFSAHSKFVSKLVQLMIHPHDSTAKYYDLIFERIVEVDKLFTDHDSDVQTAALRVINNLAKAGT
jgi:hypothetical protein